MIEGLLRLQAFFIESDPYANSFKKQYVNAPSRKKASRSESADWRVRDRSVDRARLFPPGSVPTRPPT